MNVPEWWLITSGVFFGLFIILLVAILWLVVLLIGTLKETTIQIRRLADRAEAIGERVEALAQNVQKTSQTLNSRASLVGTSLEKVAGKITEKADVLAVVMLGFRAYQWFKNRKPDA